MAVKLQLACFERLGAPGWEALEQAVAIARDHGLLVIADGKRGDVPVTARRLRPGAGGRDAGAVRRRSPGLGADAFTANPLLGRDSLEPLIEAAAARRRRLLRAGPHLEPRRRRAPGRRASRRCTSGSPRWSTSSGRDRRGDCGLSLVGAVTGATRPELLGRLRELMPRAIFLLPGVGAQGGRVEDLGAGLRARTRPPASSPPRARS